MRTLSAEGLTGCWKSVCDKYVRIKINERTYLFYFDCMSKISAARLRQNLYNYLDSVLETGIPVEIERKGKTLMIVAEKPV